MVLKTQTCRFSGLRIYPGKGILFIRTDGQQYLFINSKAKSLYNQKKRPAKIAWSVAYRRAHKKDQSGTIIKKKKRAITKAAVRSYAGASLEVLQTKRNEKPEVRKATREQQVAAIKEKKKVDAAAKSSQKAAQQANKASAKHSGKGR